MKVLVTGASGMLGLEVCRAAVKRFGRENVAGLTHYDLDICHEDNVKLTLNKVWPDVIINCAGIVKQREFTEKAFDWTNAHGPFVLAEQAGMRGLKVVQISTDCVFKDGLHVETDEPNATDVYGKSKAKGEIKWGQHLNLRMSFVGLGKRGLLNWLLSQSGTVKGYTHALWNGMTAPYAAQRILDALERKGTYHIHGQDTTKYDVLVAANETFRLGLQVEPDESIVSDMRLRSLCDQPAMPDIREQLEELARTRWTPIPS